MSKKQNLAKSIDKINNLSVVPKRDTLPSGKKIDMSEIDGIKAVVENTSEKINDVYGIKEILPDTNLISEILVSTTLAPKDLSKVKFEINSNLKIPGSIANLVRDKMQDHLDMDSKLPLIVEEALMLKGSFPILTLPASLISKFINTGELVSDEHGMSLESINKVSAQSSIYAQSLNNVPHLGLIKKSKLGKGEGINLESLGTPENVAPSSVDMFEITDNPLVLLSPKLKQANNELKTERILKENLGLESIEPNVNELSPFLKRKYKPAKELGIKEGSAEQAIADSDITNELDPVVLDIPHESVIAISNGAGDVAGYYIVLDENFKPVNKSTDSSYFKDLNNRLEEKLKADSSDTVLAQAFNIKKKKDQDFRKLITNKFEQIMEHDLVDALKENIDEPTINVANSSRLYSVMLTRLLEAKKTKMLYVPESMLTYVAFNYNSLGMGVGLIERNKLFASLRATTMISKIIGGIQNSIPNKILNIEIDEKDPAPQESLQYLLDNYSKLQTKPLATSGSFHIDDVVSRLQNSGIQVNIEGGNAFPNTKLSVDAASKDKVDIDDDLDEILKLGYYSGFGISPETIDSKLENELATSVIANDLLESKRTLVRQGKLIKPMNKHIKQYVKASPALMRQIQELIDEGKVKESLDEVINSLTMHLPSPDIAKHRANAESFSEYMDFVGEAIEHFMGEDIIGDLIEGDYADSAIPAILTSWKSKLARDYLRENNMLPELSQLSSEGIEDVTEALSEYGTNILEMAKDMSIKVLSKELKIDSKIERKLEKVEEGLEEPEEDELPEETETPEDGNVEEGGEEDPGQNIDTPPEEGQEEDLNF